MQGKLSEIDIRSILQLIELGQRTGELFVEAYPSQSIAMSATGASTYLPETRARVGLRKSWFVFFLNGEIVYAASSTAGLSRLTDYLRRYKVEAALNRLSVPAIASINALEYGYLWTLLENHTLTPAQGRTIIQGMVHETLFDLLSLHQGSFVFELGAALSPQLTSLEIAPLLAIIMKQVQEWKQFYPHIQDPDQCPVIADVGALKEALSSHTFNTLDRYADGKTSLRQIARYLNRDVLTVAKAIYPYVQKGVIQLIHFFAIKDEAEASFRLNRREFGSVQETRCPRVVCIDDGVTIRETVEHILSQHGYEAASIANPLKALSLVFQLKPDLILCDIAMPELDGYEICAMLRQSTAFRQVPIVMLTGKDGFIDRVKAKMSGATDYLTKPFGASELLMLVEKYIGPGYPERCQINQALTDSFEDEVEIGKTGANPTSMPFN